MRKNVIYILSVLAILLLLRNLYAIMLQVPDDAEQGPIARIIYFHVPAAFTAFTGFFAALVASILYLWTKNFVYDSLAVAITEVSLAFAAVNLVTGSIWARVSWGTWWSWSSNQLVTFLILFLFYSAYFMLRYSVEPGPARANMCAVYALFGVVLIPISFLAIRLSQKFIHPVVFTRDGPQMSGSMFLVFCVCLGAMLALFASLYTNELTGKRLDARLRELREALE
jgi:heme exporter protein C